MQIGIYEVESEIARGGAGVVYRARHGTRGTLVAIKVLLSQHTSPDEIERFRREAEATFRLRHPHVVGVLEFDYHQGHPYLVLEYVEGESFQERIQREGTVVVEDLIRIGEQIADALHYAHAVGLVHRDIKPHNILLEAGTGRAVLTDFGLAQFRNELTKETLTVTGEVVGTPAYMSPEQALGDRERVGPPTDVYALAATLYAGLCGRPPFDGDHAMTVMTQVAAEPVPHPLTFNPQANRALADLCMQCLAKQPSERAHTAETLREALRDLLARTTGSGQARYAPPSKLPLLVSLVVAGVVWLVIGVALGRASAPTQTATSPPPPEEAPPDPAPAHEAPVGASPRTALESWVNPERHLLRLAEQVNATGSWGDYLLLARHYLFLREPRMAADALSDAVAAAREPELREQLRYVHGKLLLELGEREPALATARQLQGEAAESLLGLRLEAMSLRGRERDAAVEAIERALKLGGAEDFETRMVRAHLLPTERRGEALAEVRALEKELKQAGVSLSNLVKIRLANLSEDQELEPLLAELTRREPGEAGFWRQRALQATGRRDWPAAERFASKAYGLDPSDIGSASVLLGALIKQKKWDRAAQLGETLRRYQPPEDFAPRIFAQLALALAQLDPRANATRIDELGQAYRREQTSASMLFEAETRSLAAQGERALVLHFLRGLDDPASLVAATGEHFWRRSVAARELRVLGRAQQDLSRVAQLTPEAPGLTAARGEIYLRQGLPTLAGKAAQDQIQERAGAGQAFALGGTALFQTGEFARAVGLFRQRPVMRPWVLPYTRSLIQVGQLEQAREAYRAHFPAQLAQLPEDASPEACERAIVADLKRRAHAQLDPRPLPGALAILDELLLYDPGDLDAQLGLLQAKGQQADGGLLIDDGVRRLLRDALRTDAQTCVDLAQVLQRHRPAFASLLWQEAFAQDPTNLGAARQAAWLLLQLGLATACERECSAALERAPDDVSLLALRGIARSRARLPGAREDLTRAHRDDPGPLAPAVSLELANLARRAGDPEVALRLSKPIVRSRLPRLRLRALVYGGWAQLQLGDRAAAEQAVDQASEVLDSGASLSKSDREVLTQVHIRLLSGR